MKKKGFFITFEGIDGSGKTTQLKLARKYLSGKGFDILTLREPGSTPLCERIRKILLNKNLNINAVSELMLYLAARAELVEATIAPSIRAGKIVLCDRFYDSTKAYQGYGRGIDIKLVEKLNRLAVGEYKPNLTFIVDIDYASSLKRRKKSADRLESESRAFFNRVRKGFLEIARHEKRRIVVLDGRKSIETIFDEVRGCLKRRLKIS